MKNPNQLHPPKKT